METPKTNGYLIIECPPGKQPHILYADSAACAITGSSMEHLLRANPEQTVENLKTARILLDTQHELWVLESCDESQYRTTIDQLRRRNIELSEALRACEEENRAKSSPLLPEDTSVPKNARPVPATPRTIWKAPSSGPQSKFWNKYKA